VGGKGRKKEVRETKTEGAGSRGYMLGVLGQNLPTGFPTDIVDSPPEERPEGHTASSVLPGRILV